MSAEPPLLTLDETAALLRCSKAHVSKLIRARVRGVKPIPAIHLGRRVLIRRDDLFVWLSDKTLSSVVR